MTTSRRKGTSISVPGILLHEKPPVYVTALPGMWLLQHSTPSWRLDDPQKGFQRIVKEQRAREIARTVLDVNRTFPNALTLATTAKSFSFADQELSLPPNTKFLVVDGQHRLWAQKYSEVEGTYPCIIHMARTEEQMASLFLEINDNQRRVPSSLRWDLVRLVRSDDQATAITSDLIFDLATRPESPFYAVGIDLTGERKEVTIKQGSLAPEIRTLVNKHLRKMGGTYDQYLDLFVRFFVAIRSLDPDGWGDPQSPFFKARVLRALIRVLSDVLSETTIGELSTEKIRRRLARIDASTLSEAAVRRMQGTAGVQDLYIQMRKQVFKTGAA
ncbi:MAG TPA: DGQHR domain-containing protein [Thermoanaerobaculia bacterium]|nr:DGQHR domain-containing protein [Thermoanaerobaculia bacterium]